MMKQRVIVGLLALALLAGCKHEGSAVQKQYMSDRQSCREYAESTSFGGYRAHSFPQEDPQIQLVRQFAHCMHKRGWAVNKPPK